MLANIYINPLTFVLEKIKFKILTCMLANIDLPINLCAVKYIV